MLARGSALALRNRSIEPFLALPYTMSSVELRPLSALQLACLGLVHRQQNPALFKGDVMRYSPSPPASSGEYSTASSSWAGSAMVASGWRISRRRWRRSSRRAARNSGKLAKSRSPSGM